MSDIISKLRRCAITGGGYKSLSNEAYYAQANMRTLQDQDYDRSNQSRMFLLFVAAFLEDDE